MSAQSRQRSLVVCVRCGHRALCPSRFCGACGQAQVHVHVQPVDGIVLQRVKAGYQPAAVRLIARDAPCNVTVDVVVPTEFARDYRVSAPVRDDRMASSTQLRLTLGPKQTQADILVHAAHAFPGRRGQIRLQSLVPLDVDSLPVVVSGATPELQIMDGGDVHPDTSEAVRSWAIRARLSAGVIRLQRVQLLDAEGGQSIAEVEVEAGGGPAALPRLLSSDDALRVIVRDWVGQGGADKVHARLRLHGAHMVLDADVTLYLRSAVDLQIDAVEAIPEHAPRRSNNEDGRPALVLSDKFDTHVVFRLINKGTEHLRLQRLVVGADARLIGVRMSRGQERERAVVLASGALPFRATEAFIPLMGVGETTSGSSEPRLLVEEFELRLPRASGARLEDGHLIVPLKMEFRSEGGGTHTQQVRMSVPARVLKVLEPNNGILALDYGTVNTFAQVSLLDSPQSWVIGDPALAPSDGRTGAANGIRSVYIVNAWGRQPVEHDAEVGDYPWTMRWARNADYVPKMRLGEPPETAVGTRNSRRYRRIQPERSQGREMDGVEAATVVLAAVLEAAERQTGYSPRRVELSHPVAFSDAAKADLQQACRNLDLDGRIALPEPVAYLAGLVADDRGLQALKYARDEWAIHIRDGLKRLSEEGVPMPPNDDTLPMVGVVVDMGGGTTDVSVFEVDGDELEVVASFGYGWLGGEALTYWIATFLAQKVAAMSPDVAPYLPERLGIPQQASRCLVDAPNDDIRRHNLQMLSQAAEDLKVSANWSATVQTVFGLGLRSARGSVEIPSFDVATSELQSTIRDFLQPGFVDIFERLATLSWFNAIRSPLPAMVVFAGNAGRLAVVPKLVWEIGQESFANSDALVFHDYADLLLKWQDRFHLIGPWKPADLPVTGGGRSDESGAAFGRLSAQGASAWSEIAKQGVVIGLSELRHGDLEDGFITVGGIVGLDVNTRLRDARWWYISRGADYELVLPAGFLPERISDADACTRAELPAGFRVYQPHLGGTARGMRDADGQSPEVIRRRAIRGPVYETLDAGRRSLPRNNPARLYLRGHLPLDRRRSREYCRVAFGLVQESSAAADAAPKFGCFMQYCGRDGTPTGSGEWEWVGLSAPRGNE